MNIDYCEKGRYFRGLLILIGKDRIIEKSERTMLLDIGENLGFDKKFCNDAILTFLGNPFINQKPPVFSSKTVTLNFLQDAINLAGVDNYIHDDERQWIENIAEINNVEKDWLEKKLNKNLVVNN